MVENFNIDVYNQIFNIEVYIKNINRYPMTAENDGMYTRLCTVWEVFLYLRLIEIWNFHVDIEIIEMYVDI